MEKQINYWMDYESFLLVVQKAIDLGCTIIKTNVSLGMVVESQDISIIQSDERHCQYYFCLLEAGDIDIYTIDDKEYLDDGYIRTGLTLIETNFSHITNEPMGFSGKQCLF